MALLLPKRKPFYLGVEWGGSKLAFENRNVCQNKMICLELAKIRIQDKVELKQHLGPIGQPAFHLF